MSSLHCDFCGDEMAPDPVPICPDCAAWVLEELAPRKCALDGCERLATPEFAFCCAAHWADYLGDDPYRYRELDVEAEQRAFGVEQGWNTLW